MNAIEVYNLTSFRINKTQNGELTYKQFNEISFLAQLNLIDWLTGSFTGQQPPEPYLTQKNRDWVSFLVTQKPYNVTNGSIVRPDDYYLYEDFYCIGYEDSGDCDDGSEETFIKIPIRLLSNDKYSTRLRTSIKSLKPSLLKPITKQVGLSFEITPADIGSVVLEYIRYPIRAEIKTKIDTTYNEEVPDEATTIHFEWPEYARPLLVWFIVQEFMAHTREKSGFEINAAIGKTPRG